MPSRRTTSRTWASINSTAPSQPGRRAASLSAVIGLPVCVPSGDHAVTMRDHPFNREAPGATRIRRPVDNRDTREAH